MIQRTTIAFFGRTNAGKSLLVNRIVSQDLSIVSDTSGTTTDPVKKVMELLPLGPVTIIDTPGIDDFSELGKQRVKKAFGVLDGTHIAVLVVDATHDNPISSYESELIEKFKAKNIPYVVALNKSDLLAEDSRAAVEDSFEASFVGAPAGCGSVKADSECEGNSASPSIFVSAKTGENCDKLKDLLASIKERLSPPVPLVKDLVEPGDLCVLVIPIDEAAPKDRIILPQQMVIRELLENGTVPVCCKEDMLSQTLESLSKKPALVITDSQAFETVSKNLPADIPLTSFSILMARFKGTLDYSLRGARFLSELKDGDTVLISEGCTHHRQCNDIGTVKLPAWIKKFSGKNLNFEFSSGASFPENLEKYALVVHCGGCMLNEKEMQSRVGRCKTSSVPVTNYGTAIAMMNGILERSLAPLTK